jgi:hypothetical protein
LTCIEKLAITIEQNASHIIYLHAFLLLSRLRNNPLATDGTVGAVSLLCPPEPAKALSINSAETKGIRSATDSPLSIRSRMSVDEMCAYCGADMRKTVGTGKRQPKSIGPSVFNICRKRSLWPSPAHDRMPLYKQCTLRFNACFQMSPEYCCCACVGEVSSSWEVVRWCATTKAENQWGL